MTDWLGGKIYEINADGSGNRLLCALNADFDMTETDTFLGSATVQGRTYLCLAVRGLIPNDFYESGFVYGLSPSTLIVDTKTGEARIAELEN